MRQQNVSSWVDAPRLLVEVSSKAMSIGLKSASGK